MASSRRKSNRRRGDRARTSVPGWLGLAAGLGIGLLLAAGIWWKDHRSIAAGPAAPPAAATEAPPEAGPARPARGSAKKPAKAGETPPPAEPPGRFQFYDMLPRFEVVVPEEDQKVRPGANAPLVETPGIYVLQAGSFPEFAEADAVKARLALLGVVSQIQKVTVDNKTYNRVRIGPIEDLGELNRLRARLRQSKIDFLVIQVGE